MLTFDEVCTDGYTVWLCERERKRGEVAMVGIAPSKGVDRSDISYPVLPCRMRSVVDHILVLVISECVSFTKPLEFLAADWHDV
jgi:hypothetical protein